MKASYFTFILLIISKVVFSQVNSNYPEFDFYKFQTRSKTSNKTNYKFIERNKHYPKDPFLVKTTNSIEKNSKTGSQEFSPTEIILNDSIRNSMTYDCNGNEITSLKEIKKDNIWINSNRMTKSYYENGLNISGYSENWVNGSWVKYYQYSYIYNNENRPTSFQSEYFPQSGNIYTENTTITYDYLGNILTILWESKKNNSITDSFRELNNYNNNGDILISTSQVLKNNIWENEQRTRHEYDSLGNETSVEYESWENNSWQINWKITYFNEPGKSKSNIIFERRIIDTLVFVRRETAFYDANQNLISWILEKWENNSWMNSSRFTTSYNQFGKRAIELYENFYNNVWVNDRRVINEYDANGRNICNYGENWEENTWTKYYRHSYTYDNKGNVLSEKNERRSYNDLINSWMNIYSYDNYGNTILGESFKWISNSWQSAEGSINIHYNKSMGYIAAAKKIQLKYLNFNKIKNNPESFSLEQNYPNPFNPSTTIEYSLKTDGFVKIKIYDILGKEIKTLVEKEQTAGTYSVKFNNTDIASGVYFYSLTFNGSAPQIRKMMLLR